MKKHAILVAIHLILVFPLLAQAGPFLVCDPQAGVENYVITGLPFVTAPVIAQTDGSLRLDLGPTTPGAKSLTVAACNAMWGCSDTVPFAFTRPSAWTAPAHLRLSP